MENDTLRGEAQSNEISRNEGFPIRKTSKGLPQQRFFHAPRPADATLIAILIAPRIISIGARRLNTRGASLLPNIKTIITVANHPAAGVCWNSNATALAGDGFEYNLDQVKNSILTVHMRDRYLEDYPFRKLLTGLNGISSTGFCFAEISGSSDPVRIMKYYRSLWLAYQALLCAKSRALPPGSHRALWLGAGVRTRPAVIPPVLFESAQRLARANCAKKADPGG